TAHPNDNSYICVRFQFVHLFYFCSRLTIFAILFPASMTSSSVVNAPKLKRMELYIRASSLPYIATKTWDGSWVPAVQALPLETATPSRSKFINNCSTCVFGKLTFTMEGTVLSIVPLTSKSI